MRGISCCYLSSWAHIENPLAPVGLSDVVGSHSATPINQYIAVWLHYIFIFGTIPKATVLFTQRSCHTHSQADEGMKRRSAEERCGGEKQKKKRRAEGGGEEKENSGDARREERCVSQISRWLIASRFVNRRWSDYSCISPGGAGETSARRLIVTGRVIKPLNHA